MHFVGTLAKYSTKVGRLKLHHKSEVYNIEREVLHGCISVTRHYFNAETGQSSSEVGEANSGMPRIKPLAQVTDSVEAFWGNFKV